MKKLLLVLISFASVFAASAQIPVYVPNPTNFAKYISVGKYNTAGLPSAANCPRCVLYNTDSSNFAFSNGSHWLYYSPTNAGALTVNWGSILGDIALQTDLINRLNLKVNYSDTGSMLAAYQRAATAMKYSDTGSMLNPYQRAITAMKYSDTAAMLSAYLRIANFTKAGIGLGNLVNRLQVVNAGGIDSMGAGTFALMPAAAVGPTLYYATDTNAIYYTNRTSYTKVAGGGSGGGGGSADSTTFVTKFYGNGHYYPLSSNPAAYLTAINSGQVIAALGFTPYNATNPSGFITGNQNISFQSFGDVVSAVYTGSTTLGPTFTVTGLKSIPIPTMVTGNLRFTGSALIWDPAVYLTSINSSQVIAALGFTPTNPNGTTAQYTRGDGSKATTDTSMIPSFYAKVRSELSAALPILYNNSTGIISADTGNNVYSLITNWKLNNTIDTFRIIHKGTIWGMFGGGADTINDKGFKNSATIIAFTNTDSSNSFNADTTTGKLATWSMLRALNASWLTAGTIPAARYGATTIPVTAINATGYVGAGLKALLDNGTWGTVAGGGGTDLSLLQLATGDTIYSSTGADVFVPLGTNSLAGLIPPYLKARGDSLQTMSNTRSGDTLLRFNGIDSFYIKGVTVRNDGNMIWTSHSTAYEVIWGGQPDTSAGPTKIATQGGAARATTTKTVQGINQLYGVNITGLADSTLVIVSDTVGQAGTWVWRSTSTKADNIGTVIKPTAAGSSGRFERSFQGPLNVQWFAKGAIDNGTTDATPAFNAVAAIPNAVVSVPNPRNFYRLANPISISASGVSFIGQGKLTTKLVSDIGVHNSLVRYRGISNMTIRNLSIKNLDTITNVNVSPTCILLVNDTLFNINPTPYSLDSNFVIDNCELTGLFAHGLSIISHRSGFGSEIKNVTITNNYIHDMGRGGLNLLGETFVIWQSNYYIAFNKIYRTGLKVPSLGIGISVGGLTNNCVAEFNEIDSARVIGLEFAGPINSSQNYNTFRHLNYFGTCPWTMNSQGAGIPPAFGNKITNNRVLDTCNTLPYYINQNGLVASNNSAVADSGGLYNYQLTNCKFVNDNWSLVNSTGTSQVLWLRTSLDNKFQGVTFDGYSGISRLVFASDSARRNVFLTPNLFDQPSTATALVEGNLSVGYNQIIDGNLSGTATSLGNNFSQNMGISTNPIYVLGIAADSLKYRIPISSFPTAASVALKLNISDTAAMLSPYLRAAVASGLYATITNLNLRVRFTDTAAMLAPYLRSAVATATYATITSDLAKVKYTDTAAMLAPYLRVAVANATFATITNDLLKVKYTDTAAMLAPYLRSAVAAGTYAPLAGADVNASVVNTYSINHTAQASEGGIFMNSGGATVLTLTMPSIITGKIYKIKNTNAAATVTLSGMGTGQPTSLAPFGSPGDGILVQCDGANWQVIATDIPTSIPSALTSGFYIPTATPNFNVTGITVDTAYFTRIGNVVRVAGHCTGTVTTGGVGGSFYLSLPVPMTGNGSQAMWGSVYYEPDDLTTHVPAKGGNPANQAAQIVVLTPTVSGGKGFFFDFTYYIN